MPEQHPYLMTVAEAYHYCLSHSDTPQEARKMFNSFLLTQGINIQNDPIAKALEAPGKIDE